MDKRIYQIKRIIKEECFKPENNTVWFYNAHLLAVEKNTKFLLARVPKANKEIVMLGAWLHDLQHVKKMKGNHEQIGASEAGKILKKFNYSLKEIKKVKEIISTHSCNKKQPKSVEAKILATADAMAHYYNDFYLAICALGDRDAKTYKKWALEKLKRDYSKKIFFSFAKETVKERHDILCKLFSMN